MVEERRHLYVGLFLSSLPVFKKYESRYQMKIEVDTNSDIFSTIK